MHQIHFAPPFFEVLVGISFAVLYVIASYLAEDAVEIDIIGKSVAIHIFATHTPAFAAVAADGSAALGPDALFAASGVE